MASSQIYSAEIGERSAATPGDIDSATAMPDVSSVNFLAFPCEGVIDAAGGGTESVSEAEYGSNKPGATTPRSTSFLNRTGAASFGASDNQRIAHMEVDTVTMTARFVEFGTSTVFDGSGDPQQPEAVMLGSVMGYDKPGITSITANGAGANFGEVPVDDLTGIEVGDFIWRAYDNGGHCSVHKVVDTSAASGAGTFDVEPWMESAVADGTVLGVCEQFYAVTGNGNVECGDFHVRVSAGANGASADFGRLIPMCRLGGLGLTADGNAVVGEWTVSAKVALDNDAAASVVSSSERTGSVLNADLDATVTIGADCSTETAPFGAAPTYATADRFGFDVNFEWTIADGARNGRSVAMAADRDVTDANMTMTLSVEHSASNEGQTLKRMMANGEQRSISVMFGPGHLPGTDNPTGMALWAIMARGPDESPVTGNDQSLLQRDVVLRAASDAPNITTASTAKAIAPFAIVWPQDAT